MNRRNSIITDNWDLCFANIAGCTFKATQCHHLISGTANRKKSDKALLVIPVCQNCHQKIHDNPEIMSRYRKLGQSIFEEHYSREEFMDIFHKNYLED